MKPLPAGAAEPSSTAPAATAGAGTSASAASAVATAAAVPFALTAGTAATAAAPTAVPTASAAPAVSIAGAPPAAPGRSLQQRLQRWLLLPLSLLFLLSGGASYWVTRYYAAQVYDRWLYDSVSSLAQQVRLTGNRVVLDLPRVAQEIFQWDDEDQTLFRVQGSRSGHIAGIAAAPARGADARRFRGAWLFDAPLNGQPMRWAELTLPDAGGGETVTVVVGETVRKRSRLAGDILLSVWLPQLVLLALVAGVTHGVIGAQMRQVHALSSELGDLSHRNLRAVSGDGAPRELQPVIDAINGLVARLEQAALAQRAFIANAAHQLRTPLTTLALLADRAVRCDSLPTMRQSVLELQGGVQRTSRLANQLLLLSRAEPEAQAASVRERIDLRELAFEVAGRWVPRALAARLDLGFDEASDSAVAEVDGALLGEALNNLLDNAINYCPPGARITVAVRAMPLPAILVEDSGPGIPVAQRDKVVQRFFRGDSAAATEGSGLGLAIVNEIALAHGGTLRISSSAQGGTRCEISLPGAIAS